MGQTIYAHCSSPLKLIGTFGKGKDAADLQVWHDSQMHGESDRPNVPAALLLLLTAVPLIFGMAGFDTGLESLE